MTLSLRARLLIGLVALALGGLLVADVATYAELKSFLFSRVDQQLLDGRFDAVAAVGGQPDAGGDHGPGPGPGSQFPAGTFAQLVSPAGAVLSQQTLGFGQTPSSAHPVLPAHLPDAGPDQPTLITTPGTGGVDQYRVLVESLDQAGGDFLVLAIPLPDLESTLQQLVAVEAIIGAAVLITIALLGLVIIRVGLRPLERMGQTATAIAGGDLSRRVQPENRRTEIGRLGLALNGMLTQIEAAFRQRLEAESRLRQFLADASHELRTPLTSIRGYAEMLRRGAEKSPDDAELARRRIEEESVRMSVLVDELLLLARLDQGRPLEQEPVDLQAVATDAADDARAMAPGRAVALDAPEPVVLIGDEARLRQAVGNLVRNALVHTPAHSPIEIGLAARAGGATLSVTDHGPGLPFEAAGRVFEPFYRADPGRSRDSGGTGLGLSIVAAVVAAHHGRVRVSETPGGGATFEIELPLAE